MSELFSWPTVTVGMSPPCVNDDPPAPGCGAAAGRFRLLVATGITIALRVARRTRTPPGRVPWSAAGGPALGIPPAPVGVRCPEPGQRIPDVRGISPPQHRTDAGRLVTGTRVRPGRPADQGHGPGAVRVRVTSPHATVKAVEQSWWPPQSRPNLRRWFYEAAEAQDAWPCRTGPGCPCADRRRGAPRAEREGSGRRGSVSRPASPSASWRRPGHQRVPSREERSQPGSDHVVLRPGQHDVRRCDPRLEVPDLGFAE